MPADVLDLLAKVLTAGQARPADSAAIAPPAAGPAPQRPRFHRRPPRAHYPGRPPHTGRRLAAHHTRRPAVTALDRTALLASLRHGAGGPVEHLAHALTADPHALGDPAGALTQVAAGPAARPPSPGCCRSWPGASTPPGAASRPATGEELTALTVVWQAALTVGPLPGALAGAGYFAYLPFDDAVWLPLARASAERTAPHTPCPAAERAAGHPGDRDALLLTARLVDRPADVCAPPQPRPAPAGTPPPGEDVPPAGTPPPVERRPRRPDTAEDTGPVRAATGPAQGLLLPGSADAIWKHVPLPLRHTLATAAYRLVTPEQPTLRDKDNRGVRYALRAAGNKRMTGRHWHALLTAPRESFGSARSERADRVFAALEEVVAQYVAQAVAQRPADGTAGPAADPV